MRFVESNKTLSVDGAEVEFLGASCYKNDRMLGWAAGAAVGSVFVSIDCEGAVPEGLVLQTCREWSGLADGP